MSEGNDGAPSAQEFLDAIFVDVPEGETPVFGLMPKGARTAKWALPGDSKVTRSKDALYFCVSTVAKATPLKKRKVDFRAAYVVVLDDIGTKIDAERVHVPPSYKLETSPGNFQWGYFIEPCTDGDLFEALMRALAAAGLTDKSCVDRVRIMRVPGSLNYKGAEPFAAVLHEWHPDRFWSVQELADAYGLTLEVERTESFVSAERAEHDPVLAWLIKRGDVRHDKGEWIDILCPWRSEHVADPRPEAGYRPLDENGTRGFKCQHTTCKDRHTQEFMRWVGEQGGPGTVDAEQTMDKLAGLLREQEVPVATPGELKQALGSNYAQFRGAFPRIAKESLPDLDCTQRGLAKIQPATFANVEHVVTRLGLTPRYDLMRKEYSIAPGALATHDYYRRCATEGDRRRATDAALGDILTMLGIREDSKRMVQLNRLALTNAYHPFEDWLRSLPARRGEAHIEALVRTIKLSDPEADAERARAYVRRWLIQCVEAACGWRKPSRQLSGVLTFAGKQGTRKTTWFRTIVPAGFYKEGASLHLSGPTARDSVFEALSGGIIVELGELETTFRASEAGALKNFLSRPDDKLRLPYGATWEDWPRMTAFCGTVNSTSFLRDHTGSRRFWPLSVEGLETDHGIDLEALWGEVYALWQAGEQWHLTHAEDALRASQAEQFEDDAPAVEGLKDFLGRCLAAPADAEVYVVTVADLCEMVGERAADRRTASDVRAVAEKMLGRRRDEVDGRRRVWLLRIPATAPEMLRGGKLQRAKAETVARYRWGA